MSGEIGKKLIKDRELINEIDLFRMRFDTEKEVHHVCFVTYQAKITWATSFQGPETSAGGHASAFARLPRATWV